MRSALLLFSLLALGFSLLCSCSTLPEDNGLDVAVVDVRLQQATMLETTALFTVRLSNESPEPVTVDGCVHKFYLNGAYVGKGMNRDSVEVARLSSTTHEVPVHLRNVAMVTRFRPIMEAKAMDYRVASTLYVVVGNRSHRCRVVHEGHLGIDDFQPSIQGNAEER